MRRGRKHKVDGAARPRGARLFRDNVTSVVIAALGVGVIGLAIYVASGPRTSTYEGRIVDKSITLSESYQGSGKTLRLHIRGRGGEVSAVKVTYETYNRAQVGMWVRNNGSGAVELSRDEPPQVVGATKTEGAETPSVSAPR
jgi:hypothetical protein